MPRHARPTRLFDPGAMLSASHELADGGHVRLRLTRPSDAPLLSGLLGSDTAVRRIVFHDPRNSASVAAAMPVGGIEEIVGVAHARPDGVEVVVAEDQRGRGVEALLENAASYMKLRAERRRAAA